MSRSRKVPDQFEEWLKGKIVDFYEKFDPDIETTLKSLVISEKDRVVRIIILVIGGLIAKTIVDNIFHSYYDVSSKRNIEKIVSEVKRSLPRKVGDNVVWLSAHAEEGLIEYDYQIDLLSSKMTAQEAAEKAKSFLMPSLTNLDCTTPQTREEVLNQGITMRYLIYDTNNKYLAEFSVRQADCLQSHNKQ